jgi:ketosteroid isomerase-like protein
MTASRRRGANRLEGGLSREQACLDGGIGREVLSPDGHAADGLCGAPRPGIADSDDERVLARERVLELEAAFARRQSRCRPVNTQENMEIVRRLYSLRADAAAIVRGDFDEVFLDCTHPDVEVVPPSIYPDTDIAYRGREGVRRWFRQMDEVWDDWRVEPERFFDAGNRVVVFVRVSGTAKQGGGRSRSRPGTS